MFATLVPIMPLLIVAVLALGMLALGLFSQRLSYVAAVTCLLALAVNWVQPVSSVSDHVIGGLVYADIFTKLFNLVILGGAGLTLLLSEGQFDRQRVRSSVDLDVLMLLAVCGAMVMVSAANLMVLFLGFELLSICVYILTGAARTERASAEGALKYFILGAFSSAFLLYGITLIYGATGSMLLHEIGARAAAGGPMLILGLGLLLFGFGFKVSLVPFHFWTPDVYQGAPISVAGFMAVVVKAAAFGSFLRIMLMAFEAVRPEWTTVFWVLSVVTMTGGNLLALRQSSVKRMLAYSSIAHAGYALIGFLVGAELHGAAATVYYMFAYALMTVAAFGVVLLASAGTQRQYLADDLESLRGFGWRSPTMGVCMVVAMLSLAGLPPLAGFMGKLYLFTAAVRGGFVSLAIIAALNSVVSLYYYLRVLVYMYFTSEESKADGGVAALSLVEPSVENQSLFGPQLAVLIATCGTVYFGIFSSELASLTRWAIEAVVL